jgi:hypothetical protein
VGSPQNVSELKDKWCKHIDGDVQWFKEHTDREGQSLMRHERLSIEVNLLADAARAEAAGPLAGARSNCPQRPTDGDSLFILGIQVISNMKQQLASQLNDLKL